MNLDDIRVKDIEELNDDEKKFVGENWTKLTTEEQDYYKPLHTEEGGEFKLPYKTQEEFDSHVDKLVEDKIEARKKAREDEKKAKTSSEDRIFPEGFKAKDWNEAFSMAIPKVQERIIKEIQGMNLKQREALDKINKDFDQEFEDIATKNPSLPKRGTTERDDWEAEVAAVGTKYNQHTMTKAYELWRNLRTAKGGVGGEAAEIITEGRPASDLTKKISRGYGAGGSAPKTKYYVGGGRRLDDILEQRKREEGIES